MSEIVYDVDGVRLYKGDVLATLAELEPDSIDCVVTSPPYWSLRKYTGDGSIWGGDAECAHEWGEDIETIHTSPPGSDKQARNVGALSVRSTCSTCSMCGAWRGQYGLEPTPAMYVEHTLIVLRAIRRVLKPSGVVWWNIGDSYATGAGRNDTDPQNIKRRSAKYGTGRGPGQGPSTFERAPKFGGKPKDLVAMPWRVGLAAQEDGWWLRADVIWAKPNPMPESVTDRPTKAHEYVLMLTKSERYFWDQDAVREPHSREWWADGSTNHYKNGNAQTSGTELNVAGRNMRSVWSIATQPSPLPHFAAFPEELAERCIKASTPADGVMLDPFAGTGTALKVARDLGRRAVGIEISGEYCELARQRLEYGVRGAVALSKGQGELLSSG